jgi:hypothetical protein
MRAAHGEIGHGGVLGEASVPTGEEPARKMLGRIDGKDAQV